MVAVMSKLFGLKNIELAEDIISETFLQATQSWSKEIPENPTAWLYAVAKQKTLYHFRRQKIYEDKVIPQLDLPQSEFEDNKELDFSEENIFDSQLQMMFAICSPVIASEAQIGLALRILCGFGIEEIAEAFFTNKEVINKRLFRAKDKLRTENLKMELPEPKEIASRLDNVLHIIYLLFNEGYYSTTQNQIIKNEFCREAIRLALLLTRYELTNVPKTNALLALMCYHSSRLSARKNSDNNIILYDDQDEQLWNQELINQGNYFLNLAAQRNALSSYHLEAGIAYWHCQKEDTPEKWNQILYHYNLLLQINYAPTVALNRIYSLYKSAGAEAALAELKDTQLPNNHFYFTLLGELYRHNDKDKARIYYEKALEMVKTQVDKSIIKNKIENL
jgi:RNA polymerase sigma-70 factor (ECF subfamily)